MESQRTTTITAFNRNSKLTRKEIKLLAQCASEIENEVGLMYDHDTKDALWTAIKSVIEKFGLERVQLITAASILQYKRHAKIHAAWANDTFSDLGVASSATEIPTVSQRVKDALFTAPEIYKIYDEWIVRRINAFEASWANSSSTN